MKLKKNVFIVHAVDTEGPLFESLEAKFERLRDLFNIKIEPTYENLEKLKNKKINLNGRENAVAKILSSHLGNYNDNWSKIDLMIDKIFSNSFRNKDKDSYGNCWSFNWHCLDHVGYDYNPRRRDIGYHNIFDYYSSVLNRYSKYKDRIHWHFHPMSNYREAHRCATSFINSPHLYQILSRRIIERNWFPCVFRAGFQVERPDSNWFLEQWIPFDISNMSTEDAKDLDSTVDFRLGRSGDWRRAPKDWTIYHPSHDDYQTPGNCRRWIGRALNVLNRIASINEHEIEKGFKFAENNNVSLIGIASHDFRDLAYEVDYLRKMIKKVSKKFPNINFIYSEAKEAFSNFIKIKENIKEIKALKFKVDFKKGVKSDVPRIIIKTQSGEVFGPQPFLAIETKSRNFIHDNLDFDKKKGVWHYAFHGDTLSIEDVNRIGIASNDKLGNTFIKRLKFNNSYYPKFY